MKILLLLILFGLPKPSTILQEKIYMIELNHLVYYSESDKEIKTQLSQYIFWDECNCDVDGCKGQRVNSWKINKFNIPPQKINDRYVFVFTDDGKTRQIESELFKETIIQTDRNLPVKFKEKDPEVIDRKIHPENLRKGLKKHDKYTSMVERQSLSARLIALIIGKIYSE